MRPGTLNAWIDPDGISVGDVRDRKGRIVRDKWDELVAIRWQFVNACRAWRDAAAADGWFVRQTYAGESIDWAWTAEREGWKVMGISRPDNAWTPDTLPTAYLHIWAPDTMRVSPPPIYDWDAMQIAARTCMECGAHPVETHRVGFTDRCCEPCATRLRPQVERPGWCD